MCVLLPSGETQNYISAQKEPSRLRDRSQIRVKTTDLIMVRVETDHLEDLYHKIGDKDLNIVNVSFRITAIREVHHNKIIHNMVTHVNRIFKGTK